MNKKKSEKENVPFMTRLLRTEAENTQAPKIELLPLILNRLRKMNS